MYIHRFLLLPLMSLLCSFLELMGCFQLFVVFLLGASDHEDGFTVLLVEFKPNLQFSLFGGWQSISFFGALWWSNESKNQTQSPSQTDTSSSATRPISQIDISTNAPGFSLCLLRGYGHLRPIPPRSRAKSKKQSFDLKICHDCYSFCTKILWETKKTCPKKWLNKSQHQAQLAVSQADWG